MSYPDEDHGEYAPKEHQFIEACNTIEAIDSFVKGVCERSAFLDTTLGISHAKEELEGFRAALADLIDDHYHDTLKEARDITERYDDGYRADVQSYYNTTRI